MNSAGACDEPLKQDGCKTVLLNSRHHRMVRQWQTLFLIQYSGSYFEVLPDFVKLRSRLVLRDYGLRGPTVAKPLKGRNLF